jgi:hypothetical protein
MFKIELSFQTYFTLQAKYILTKIWKIW